MGHFGDIISENAGHVLPPLAKNCGPQLALQRRAPDFETGSARDQSWGKVTKASPLRNQTRIARLTLRGPKRGRSVMTQRRADDAETDEPVTLHRTIQMMLGEKLRAYYHPPKKLSHELFVLMIQIKEQERRQAAALSRKTKMAEG
jgi:hypothetical protein